MQAQRISITLVATGFAEFAEALGNAAQAIRSFAGAWRTMKRRQRAAAIRTQNLKARG